ncbi:MAG: sporulation protein YunB, partial [Oscillospiraceae bacterium]|nr:sporulation protein YunB [Oscillospiraceae bacterium]
MPVPRRRPPRFRRNVRPPASPRRRVLRFAALGLTVFIALFVWAEAKIRPYAAQMALSRVHILATGEINRAVDDIVSMENLQYGDLVYFEKNVTGQITALKTDMAKVNHLKAAVTQRVLDRLRSTDTEELSIPLGNIINGDLLSGRGPSIPVRIVPVGMVDSGFLSSFTSAGINQTRHQIIMRIDVTIGVLLPGVQEETHVEAQVNIAETILVGSVPESYLQFGGEEIFS